MRSTTTVFVEAIGSLLLLQIVSLAGCSRRDVTREECDQLLARYTTMYISSERRDLSNAERSRLAAEVRSNARQNRSFQGCTNELDREQMDCALAANNVDEIERCLIPMPP